VNDAAQRITSIDGPRPEPTATPVPVPRTVGRYQLAGPLGAGGMGIVYCAQDPALEREVAVKLIRPELLIDEGWLRRRFLREAQMMARLKHENVVTIYDVGIEGEQIYLVMELIDGITLREWLDDEQRDWREVLARFIDAGRGLSALHERGLVHRDFKPDNVLVAGSRVVITDFGLACTFAPPPEEHAAGTSGTPRYMAPEQFRGDAPDARTDIFSFCAALYEALYREPAFEGDSLAERRVQVLNGRLRPLPMRTAVPRTLDAILVRGLSINPNLRPSSMAELLYLFQHAVPDLSLPRVLRVEEVRDHVHKTIVTHCWCRHRRGLRRKRQAGERTLRSQEHSWKW
jgi:eukaryotic-like serine/threonine-protein kinase